MHATTSGTTTYRTVPSAPCQPAVYLHDRTCS